ncbi:Mur ligase [Mycena floridula]|nr:Mur ligase [Mycena floridula]
MASRSYKDAVDHLNSLQTNAATLDAVRASGGRSSSFAIPEMLEYLAGIGYQPEDLNALNVVHITGTKGKGSTSAFASSILQHVKPDWKIGLYTSPHLIAVRERIRINGIPLSEEEFAKYFFQVWDKLDNDFVPKYDTTPHKPGYFRFMTLLAYHVFLQLEVDATVLEVGVGGTYDSTNIVPKPIVTGVTALGIDHVTVLGKTLEEIAWQKGGIYKKGVPAFSVPQPEGPLSVLKQRAEELGASSFTVTTSLPGLAEVKLGLAGAHQVLNATLAVSLCSRFLRVRDGFEDQSPLPSAFIEGLVKAKWAGRCQSIQDPAFPKINWFLDGAHTLESLDCCLKWYVSPEVGITAEPHCRVLVFNCTNGRSGPSFIRAIYGTLAAQLKLHSQATDAADFFDQVIFCTNVTYADGASKGDLTKVAAPSTEFAEMKDQRQVKSAWLELAPAFPEDHIHVLPSLEHAVRCIRNLESTSTTPLSVLATGSLYLVGGLIEVGDLASVAL